jgi:hypothetical protein
MLTYIAHTLDMMLETIKTISSTLLRFNPFYKGGDERAPTGGGGAYGASAAKTGRQGGPVRGAAKMSS